jgi:hypothetical protein
MEYGVVLPHIGPQARTQVVERIKAVARHARALIYPRCGRRICLTELNLTSNVPIIRGSSG